MQGDKGDSGSPNEEPITKAYLKNELDKMINKSELKDMMDKMMDKIINEIRASEQRLRHEIRSSAQGTCFHSVGPRVKPVGASTFAGRKGPGGTFTPAYYDTVEKQLFVSALHSALQFKVHSWSLLPSNPKTLGTGLPLVFLNLPPEICRRGVIAVGLVSSTACTNPDKKEATDFIAVVVDEPVDKMSSVRIGQHNFHSQNGQAVCLVVGQTQSCFISNVSASGDVSMHGGVCNVDGVLGRPGDSGSICRFYHDVAGWTFLPTYSPDFIDRGIPFGVLRGGCFDSNKSDITVIPTADQLNTHHPLPSQSFGEVFLSDRYQTKANDHETIQKYTVRPFEEHSASVVTIWDPNLGNAVAHGVFLAIDDKHVYQAVHRFQFSGKEMVMFDGMHSMQTLAK